MVLRSFDQANIADRQGKDLQAYTIWQESLTMDIPIFVDQNLMCSILLRLNVREYESFFYEDIQSNRKEDSTEINTMYNVYLCKQDGEWIIYDITSNDPFDSRRYDDYDKLIKELEDSLYEDTVARKNGTAIKAKTSASKSAYSGGDYNYSVTDAINYAYTYSSRDYLYHNYNFYYYNSNGQTDCTNFVSQCIWAGLGGSDNKSDINSHANPMTHLWYNDQSGNHTASWTGTNDFVQFARNWDGESDSVDRIVFYDYDDCYISNESDNSILNCGNLLGSALVLKENGSYTHAIIITKIETDENGEFELEDIYYSAHNADRKNESLKRIGNIECAVVAPYAFWNADYDHIHTYTAVTDINNNGCDTTCNHAGCDYCRMRIYPETLGNPKYIAGDTSNNTINIRATCQTKPYRMAAKVEYYSSGNCYGTPTNTQWLGEITNRVYYNKTYQLQGAGIYYVTIYARDCNDQLYPADSTNIGRTFAFRAWQ